MKLKYEGGFTLIGQFFAIANFAVPASLLLPALVMPKVKAQQSQGTDWATRLQRNPKPAV